MATNFNLDDRIEVAINAAFTRFDTDEVVADDAQIVNGMLSMQPPGIHQGARIGIYGQGAICR